MISLLSVLTVFFVILALLLGILILIQQGKGDMGLGGLGASSQMLFGGSGGQDFFEKVTWTFGFVFIFGALGLAYLKSHGASASKIMARKSSRVATYQPAPVEAQPEEAPQAQTESEETAQ